MEFPQIDDNLLFEQFTSIMDIGLETPVQHQMPQEPSNTYRNEGPRDDAAGLFPFINEPNGLAAGISFDLDALGGIAEEIELNRVPPIATLGPMDIDYTTGQASNNNSKQNLDSDSAITREPSIPQFKPYGRLENIHLPDNQADPTSVLHMQVDMGQLWRQTIPTNQAH